MSKYPRCECQTKKYDYFRKCYKNGTLHMFRKCPSCEKVAQSAMSQSDYDANWVSELRVSENGVAIKSNLQSRADHVQSRATPVQSRNRVQSRADAIHAKLQRHILSRNSTEV